MKLLEWSDTQLEFHITEKIYENGTLKEENDVDLTEYDKIILTIKYVDWVVEYEGSISEESDSNVIFDIFSEATKWRAWKAIADIWGVKGEKKVRFNSFTIDWDVLYSIQVPEWIVNGWM